MAKKKREDHAAEPAKVPPFPEPQKSEVPKPVEPAVAAPAPATTSVSASDENGTYDGERMKKAREQKGLSLKEISERTKISVGTLSALEEERYEDMPSARVYVRGFVRCFAEEIGLDKDQVSQSYVPRWERWFNENSRRY